MSNFLSCLFERSNDCACTIQTPLQPNCNAKFRFDLMDWCHCTPCWKSKRLTCARLWYVVNVPLMNAWVSISSRFRCYWGMMNRSPPNYKRTAKNRHQCMNAFTCTMETRYNEVNGTRKFCLLHQVFCYISSINFFFFFTLLGPDKIVISSISLYQISLYSGTSL